MASLVSKGVRTLDQKWELLTEGKGKKPLQTKSDSEEETSSESETDEQYMETDDDDNYDDDEEYGFVKGRFCNGLLGHGGIINVLFETPSGFAIFAYDGIKLLKPNAMQDIWKDFVNEYVAKRHIPCMSGPHVDELLWGLKVTKLIIEKAGVVFECDRCVDDHHDSLRGAAEHIKKISCIDTQSWDLLKLAAAFKRAKEAYEAEQAREAASYHETGLDRKEIHHGTTPVIIDELTESVCDIILSAGVKERQVPPTQAPVISLKRYTQISSHPLHRVNEPGILSMDIHSSKDILATGGVDTNVVLFDWPSGQILCTLTGHTKKNHYTQITSLKFVNRDELLLIGSADKTVRVWQGSEDRTYSCIHTLKNHTAEVEAVTVNSTHKHFVTASKDHSWCLYDISTGCCLAQVGKGSGQDGYTSASFHPDDLILGTGTTDAIVKLWDFRTSNAVNMLGHVGPDTAMSFSNNGYFLATAALDGVKRFGIFGY
uniref:Pre-mRNA-processing factor 19 n=1 Tax=Oryza rufipogon TaxID=4529 RepID=A0A0E0NWK2_ORYRU